MLCKTTVCTLQTQHASPVCPLNPTATLNHTIIHCLRRATKMECETSERIVIQKFFCIVIVLSILLNFSLGITLIYHYARRGPNNPIFPQMLYCKDSLNSSKTAECTNYFTAPAQDALKYKVQKFSTGFERGAKASIYMHAPSDEVDRAWKDLYNGK